ncbi:MAG TPA: hypothetical protein DCE08_07620 [Ruminococcaceae bacterium]|nr:hypothetical protein [Oscillospiraceae bacterium]
MRVCAVEKARAKSKALNKNRRLCAAAVMDERRKKKSPLLPKTKGKNQNRQTRGIPAFGFSFSHFPV